MLGGSWRRTLHRYGRPEKAAATEGDSLWERERCRIFLPENVRRKTHPLRCIQNSPFWSSSIWAGKAHLKGCRISMWTWDFVSCGIMSLFGSSELDVCCRDFGLSKLVSVLAGKYDKLTQEEAGTNQAEGGGRFQVMVIGWSLMVDSSLRWWLIVLRLIWRFPEGYCTWISHYKPTILGYHHFRKPPYFGNFRVSSRKSKRRSGRCKPSQQASGMFFKPMAMHTLLQSNVAMENTVWIGCLKGTSSKHGGISIATFDYRRVRDTMGCIIYICMYILQPTLIFLIWFTGVW